MITKLEVVGPQGTILNLPLGGSDSGIKVRNIEGLDPVKATITSSTFAKLDGSRYQQSRRENRNILLTMDLEPYAGETENYGASVSDLRSLLYSWFMPKNNVTFKIYVDGSPKYLTTGMVESFESPLFTKTPQVVISIICFDPAFYAITDFGFSGTSVNNNIETILNYPGNIEAGYTLTFKPNRSINGFSIFNRRPDGYLASMDIQKDLYNGDQVIISTEPGNKYVSLRHNGAQSSILYSVGKGAIWGPLWPGRNFFRVYCSGASIPYDIVYKPKYGGL